MSDMSEVQGVGVIAIVPARDEQDRVAATVAALRQVAQVEHVIVVDDGSGDGTASAAQVAGADVIRHDRNKGKAAALTTGAARARELNSGAVLLFADADLEGSATHLGVLIEPVLSGVADMTIAQLPVQTGAGGQGVVVRTAADGIERISGWRPTQPLSGQRCLTREALDDALPLASGWGIEVGLTIDLLGAGRTVIEVPCPLRHRATGNDWVAQVHRSRQLADVTRAIAQRGGNQQAGREVAKSLGQGARTAAEKLAGEAREKGGPLANRLREKGGPVASQLKAEFRRAWREARGKD